MMSHAIKPMEGLREFIGPVMAVATVTHYFSRISVAVLSVHSPLREGEAIHIVGPSTDFVDTVRSMEIDHRPIEIAFPGEDVGLKVSSKVRAGDKIYVEVVDE